MLRLLAFAWVVVLALSGALIARDARAQESSSRSSTRLKESPAKSTGLTNLAWRSELGGEFYSEGMDEAAAANLSASLRMDYRLTDWMKMRLEPRMQIYTSRVQERLESDEYQTKIRLYDAYLSLRPIKQFEFRAGAIGQHVVDQPLMISRRRSFPGLVEIFSLETRPVNAAFVAQQMIPTSHTMNDERTSKEPLPEFQTQTLQLSGKHSVIQWEASAGHFNWSHIPNKVASESGSQGNWTESPGVIAGSQLKYGHDGFMWGGNVCACGSSPFNFKLSYNGIHNQRAPAAYADGQMITLAPSYHFGSKELTLEYSNFFLEADATVAKYARRTMGFTNRIGDILELSLHFHDQGFKIVGQWVNARTLSDRPNDFAQRTMTQYNIWVETDYASF